MNNLNPFQSGAAAPSARAYEYGIGNGLLKWSWNVSFIADAGHDLKTGYIQSTFSEEFVECRLRNHQEIGRKYREKWSNITRRLRTGWWGFNETHSC